MCATSQADADDAAAVSPPANAKTDGAPTRPRPHVSFFKRPIWQNLLMPLVTNTIPIVVATFVIGQAIKNTEYEDKIRSAGVLVRVELIKADYTLVREMALKLRRMHSEIDAALGARAAGMPSNISAEALTVLAALDDAFYFIGVLDDRAVTRAESDEFAKSIGGARAFARALHDCLAPAVVLAEVKLGCATAIRRYRSETATVEPSLALHLVDNTLLALRRQLPR
jgi:hypothetical protein